MHIPDGFIDIRTATGTGILSAAALGVSIRRLRRDLPARRVPLLGLAAAFIFSVQMLNFPVAGGTSGHLVGGALASVLLGPEAAIVVITSVLAVQCLLFADGGILALGANVFNMAVVCSVTGWLGARLVRMVAPGLRGQVAGMAFAGWISAVVASVACAAELAWSGTVAWGVALPAMVGVHMLIGLGEGLISALVLVAILRTRPDLVPAESGGGSAPTLRGPLVLGLIASLGLALLVSPFACAWPDGLDSVALRLGFDHRALAGVHGAPAPDYLMPGIASRGLATAIAGGVGTVVALGLALALGWILARGRPAAGGSREAGA